MRRKRVVIVILAGFNLLLLALLLFQSYSLPAAYAQVGGRAGDFVSVTAKAAGQSYDVVYVLDVPARKLHGFYPTGALKRDLGYAPHRDLEQDFGRK